MKKKSFLSGVNFLLFTLIFSLPTLSRAQFTWATNNGTITINSFTGTGAATIPATITGLPVTAIAAAAFLNDSGLTSVAIPASITNIGNEAFSICPNLTAINVNSTNPVFSSVNGVLFDVAQTTLLAYPGGLNGNYTVPTTVTSIGENAFYDCTGLSGVTLPNGLLAIDSEAFGFCVNLTNINIPATVTTIEGAAFEYCAKLPNISIPASVTTIGDGVFAVCSSLVAINVDPANPNYRSVNGVLYNKNQTTLIEFPAGLGGFYLVPNGVTAIGDEAFQQCAVTSIAFPASVARIGNYTFYYADSLTNFTFQGNAPSLGDYALSGVGTSAIVYYFAGTQNWAATYGGVRTELLNPPQPTLTIQNLTGGQVQLSFPSTLGVNYYLDRATSLLPPITWTQQTISTGTNIEGTGRILSVTNTPDSATNDFWRLHYSF